MIANPDHRKFRYRVVAISLCLLSVLPSPGIAQSTESQKPAVGRLTGWGQLSEGKSLESTLPSGWDTENIVAVSANGSEWMALNLDGVVITGGRSSWSQNPVPDRVGKCKAIDMGLGFAMALRIDGTVAIWGDAGAELRKGAQEIKNAVAISAGYRHAAVVTEDGHLNFWSPWYEPSAQNGTKLASLAAQIRNSEWVKNVIAINSTHNSITALKNDGSTTYWSYRGTEVGKLTNIPEGTSGDTVRIDTGGFRQLMIDESGAVANTNDKFSIPVDLPPIEYVRTGREYAVARLRNGGVHAWGTPAVPIDLAHGRFRDLIDFDINLQYNGESNFVIGIEPSYLSGFGAFLSSINLPRLKSVLADFEKARLAADNDLLAFEARYLEELEKLKTAAANNDHQNIVARIEDEMANFRDRTRAPFPQVKRLIELQRIYRDGAPEREARRNAGVVAVYEKAAADLQALQDKLTQSKKLQAAVETRAHRERVVATLELLKNSPVQPTSDSEETPARHTFDPVPEEKKIFSIDDPRVPGELVAVGTSGGFKFDPDVSDTKRIIDVASDSAQWWAIRSNGSLFGYEGPQKIEPNAPKLKEIFANSGRYGFERNGEFWCPSGRLDPPKANADPIAVKSRHYDLEDNALALYSDGTVRGWGEYYERDQLAMRVPPEANENRDGVQISVGYSVAAVLRKNGEVVVWGANDGGAYELPPTFSNIVKILADFSVLVGLKADGTVVAWHPNSSKEPQLFVPPGLIDVVDIAVARDYIIALRADGTWVGWGDDHDTGILKELEGLNGVRWASPGRNPDEGFIIGIRPDPEEMKR